MLLNNLEIIVKNNAEPVVQRYCVTNDKLQREVLLLKGRYCKWRKCSFCDYWADGSNNLCELDKINYPQLDKITGATGALEIINSGSIFELPKTHLEKIKQIIKEKNIHTFIYESHFMYRDMIPDFNKSLACHNIIVKTGLETYDDHFRENILLKGFENKLDHDKFHQIFNCVNLLVGIKGQTIAMLKRDLEIAIANTKLVIINIFTPNSMPIEVDHDLIAEFMQIFPQYDLEHVILYSHQNSIGLG